MKQKILLWLIPLALALVACNKSKELLNHDPVQTAPFSYSLTQVKKQYAKRAGALLFFQLDVTNSANDVLALTFANDGEILPSGRYEAASASDAVSGDLVADQSSFTFGGTRRISVNSGSVDVSINGSNLSLNGTVTLTNGLHLDVDFSGDVLFEIEPEVPKEPEWRILPNLVYTENGLEAGFPSNSVSVRVGDGDATYSYENWTATWGGSGSVLAIQFYSPDGRLHPGVYTPGSALDSYGEGQYNIGGNLVLGEGIVIPGQGSNLWTVSDGAATASPISAGEITVSLEDGIYTITLNQGEDGLQLKYQGAIDALAVEEEIDYSDYTPLPKLLSTANNLEGAFGAVESVTLMFGTEDVDYVYENWTATYSGTGNILTLEIYSADGALHAGSYTVGEGGAGTFRAGYDAEVAPGVSIPNQGSIWWTVTEGVATGEHITDGKVSVREIEGGYAVRYEGHDGLKLVYQGPVSIQ